MSETPKSFEEWWSMKNLPLDCFAALDARGGWDAHAYWSSLPPQTAAAPARQDAAPDAEKPQFEEHGWDSSGHTYAENHESFRGWGPINPAHIASTQPLQTAVGEGELLFYELFERSKDDHAMIVGSEIREVIMAARAAIAQRDELHAAYADAQDCIVRTQAAHEKEFAELVAQRDEARKEAERFLTQAHNAEGNAVYQQRRAEATEAKLAAGFKEEELEILDDLLHSAKHILEDVEMGIDRRVEAAAWIDRKNAARSLPSEPQSESRKAVEK